VCGTTNHTTPTRASLSKGTPVRRRASAGSTTRAQEENCELGHDVVVEEWTLSTMSCVSSVTRQSLLTAVAS
jgi:hypothetical protein